MKKKLCILVLAILFILPIQVFAGAMPPNQLIEDISPLYINTFEADNSEIIVYNSNGDDITASFIAKTENMFFTRNFEAISQYSLKNVAKIKIHSYRGTNPSVVEYVNFDTGTLYPISELPDSDDDFSISVAYTVRCAFEYNPNTYQIINAKIPTISSSDYTYECMNLVSMAPAITSEQMSISSDSVYYDIKVTPRMKYRVNGEVTIPLIQYESFESFSVSI